MLMWFLFVLFLYFLIKQFKEDLTSLCIYIFGICNLNWFLLLLQIWYHCHLWNHRRCKNKFYQFLFLNCFFLVLFIYFALPFVYWMNHEWDKFNIKFLSSLFSVLWISSGVSYHHRLGGISWGLISRLSLNKLARTFTAPDAMGCFSKVFHRLLRMGGCYWRKVLGVTTLGRGSWKTRLKLIWM